MCVCVFEIFTNTRRHYSSVEIIVENRRTGVSRGARLSLQVGGVWNVADYRQVQSATTENEERREPSSRRSAEAGRTSTRPQISISITETTGGDTSIEISVCVRTGSLKPGIIQKKLDYIKKKGWTHISCQLTEKSPELFLLVGLMSVCKVQGSARRRLHAHTHTKNFC